MTEVVIVYWRDIPAQVIAGRGSKRARVQLSQRFERAIGRCAMKTDQRDTDSYLAQWRRGPAPLPPGAPEAGNPEAAAHAVAERLEAEYDLARLRALIDNDGWAAG